MLSHTANGMNVNGHHSIICTASKKERSESQKAKNTAGNSKNPSKEKSRITAAPPRGKQGLDMGSVEQKTLSAWVSWIKTALNGYEMCAKSQQETDK